mgnify:CR=1 FL=1
MLKFSKTPYMIHAVLKILLRSCWSAGLLTYYRFVSEGVEYRKKWRTKRGIYFDGSYGLHH